MDLNGKKVMITCGGGVSGNITKASIRGIFSAMNRLENMRD